MPLIVDFMKIAVFVFIPEVGEQHTIPGFTMEVYRNYVLMGLHRELMRKLETEV